MAITSCHFDFYCDLRRRGLLPQKCSILEIGQANWYGDKNPWDLRALIADIADAERRQRMLERFDSLFTITDGVGNYLNSTGHFDTAELFYDWIFQPLETYAIDLHGTDSARPWDLNTFKVSWENEVVINNGTAEHIFNVAQVFRTMHDACKVGGLMIHDAPFTGWVDHGFYCLQPTLFYDLARVNNYELLSVWVCNVAAKSHWIIECREGVHELAKAGTLPDNGMLLVAFRKTVDSPFAIPMQGVYEGAVSGQAMANWHSLR
jgi:hypothetical protein